MAKFSFDLNLTAALTIEAEDYDKAIKLLRFKLDCVDVDAGELPNGDNLIIEVTMNDDPTLFALDGDPVQTCISCGAVEGTPEWGTVGDGYDGLCPSCADDEAENEEED